MFANHWFTQMIFFIVVGMNRLKKQFKTALKVIYDLCLHWLLVFYVTTCT